MWLSPGLPILTPAPVLKDTDAAVERDWGSSRLVVLGKSRFLQSCMIIEIGQAIRRQIQVRYMQVSSNTAALKHFRHRYSSTTYMRQSGSCSYACASL